MKRLSLLIGMLLGMAVLVGTVVFASPYRPAARMCPEDIQEIWDIEDVRTQSEKPLVTALENSGVPLAYDTERNTFYCTLGLGHAEEWPEISIRTSGNSGEISLVFIDDFAYDACADAISSGYSYEMMAYTDSEYDYFNVVFTGIPILHLSADEKMTREDTPSHVVLSTYGEPVVSLNARAHLRGGVSSGSEKKGYRVEYTRSREGGKIQWHTPGLGLTDTILLLPMVYDRLLMRDRLSWDLFGKIKDEGAPFGARASAYAEVFVNGRYEGVYLMLTPFDEEAEISKKSRELLQTSGVYRTCVQYLIRDELMCPHPYKESSGYRLFYTSPEREPFAMLDTYLSAITETNDDIFCEKMLKHFDLNDMMTTQLLIQAGGMSDNVFNNLYIWAEKTPQGEMYHYFPWDMDMAWGMKMEDIGERYERWLCFPPMDRLLNLNPDGQIRRQFGETWSYLRNTVLNKKQIASLLDDYVHELNDSGAMLRNAERWEKEDYQTDPALINEFVEVRLNVLDEAIDYIAASDGPIDFLMKSNYTDKSVSMGNEDETALIQ